MLGHPNYNYDDIVSFKLSVPVGQNEKEASYEERIFTGSVEIIDAWGTFEQNEEPSYDILVENAFGDGTTFLFKHIRESEILSKKQ